MMSSIVTYCTAPSSDCESDDAAEIAAGIDPDQAVSQSRLRPAFCSRRQLRRELKCQRFRWDLNDINYFLYSQLFPVWMLWLVRLSLTAAYAFTLVYVCVTSATVAIKPEYDEVPNPFESMESPGNDASNANSSRASQETQKRQPFIVYLTYWNFLVTCIYLVGSSAVMLLVKLTDGEAYRLGDGPYLVAWTRQIKRRPISGLPAWLAAHCLWLAMHTSYTATLLVTSIGLYHSLNMPTYARLFMHGCNSLLMLADACTGGLPFRLAYLVYVELAGWLYLAFSALYWSCDPPGNVLYPGLLDWNSPSWTIAVACIVSLVCTPSLHCLWWLCASRWRTWLGHRRLIDQQLMRQRRQNPLIVVKPANSTDDRTEETAQSAAEVETRRPLAEVVDSPC